MKSVATGVACHAESSNTPSIFGGVVVFTAWNVLTCENRHNETSIHRCKQTSFLDSIKQLTYKDRQTAVKVRRLPAKKRKLLGKIRRESSLIHLLFYGSYLFLEVAHDIGKLTHIPALMLVGSGNNNLCFPHFNNIFRFNR